VSVPGPQDRLAGLSREQRAALFEQLRKRKERADTPPDRIPRRPPGLDPVPASYAQERLWFLDRLAPGNAAYNIPLSLGIRGDISMARLEAVLGQVVRRHDTLRTTFGEREGQPVQVITPPGPWTLPLVDLTALSGAAREAESRRLAQEEADLPFDLQRGPLLRAVLLRLGGSEHALLLTLHHIVADGWSLGVLVRDITALYSRAALPELPVQYADFAVWQRGWLTGDVLERQVSYWRERLAGAPAQLDLPTDRPRPAAQTYRGAQRSVPFGPGFDRELSQVARRFEATPFMVLLAGFQTLLGRLSGQEDLSVGSPIANRNRAEIEPLIGFFVNTLVMRGDLSDDPAFGELLGRVRKSTLEAYAHQDLPFEHLVQKLRPERHLAVTPLFQVVCAMQNAPVGRVDLPGISLAPVDLVANTTRFDLELHGWEVEDGLLAQVFYSTELFDDPTVLRLVRHLETLLRAAMADPGTRLSDLPLLAGAERHQLLREWNDSAAEPSEMGIVDLVVARAIAAPEAPAVVAGATVLTYAELLDRASRLAGELRSVDLDRPVGLCVERSPELVIGALAVLLAGGAYLPLDPSYPEDRLAFIVRESRMPALLVRGDGIPSWAGDARVLRLDQPSASAPAEPIPTDPESLAYVIYTSGSTGRPKGVQVPHGGLMSLVLWHLQTYGVTAEDRATLVASPAFDASVWEIWPCLAAGASLHVPDEETRLDPGLLLEWMAAERITLSFLPTPLAEQVVETAIPGNLRLRALLTGGDRLQKAPRKSLPFTLVNHYGPTESSVVATCAVVELGSARPPSIGRPIDGTRAFVVDARLDPVPIGTPGELLLGGTSLARGYLGRPDLTAERFVPASHGQRLYRTGDLVRLLPDGELDFLGRVDTQVKLRGFRIELGEIESVLLRHPAVREAVVALRGDRLAAYVVCHPDAGTGEVSEHVAQWQTLYDETYARSQAADATFDIEGWNSSYTGQPIPAQEMREWVEGTVERILALNPRHVVEIGCGTGLLLFRVAPRTERYIGSDFSRVALDGIRRRLDGLPQVSLRQAEADDWTGIKPGEADLVVLNSVVQYFPGIDYLARVLERAVRAVSSGGAVFVGDVRSRPLLEAFATSVELFQSPPSRSLEELRHRVRRRVADEEELVIDPVFFLALAKRIPGVRRVDLRIRRGRWHNELTRFRYDAILHVREGAPSPAKQGRDGEESSRADIERFLADAPETLILANLPNARLANETAALDLLGSDLATVEDLRRSMVIQTALDPEDLYNLGDRLGYDVELTLDPASPFRFGALLRKRGSAAAFPEARLPDVPDLPWSAFANDPLAAKTARRLAPELRRFLQSQLPDYMVPSAFVVLENLPVTTHGKVDRAALPEPEPPRSDAGTPPRTAAETRMASLWKEVLGVEEVHLEDNFFGLGGHSLLATQLVSRVRSAFGIDLPLRRLFERPTLGELTAILETETPTAALVEKRERRTEAPISLAQERFWVLGRDSTAFNAPSPLRIRGPLDAGVLERCFQEVLRRQGSLRTRFVERDGDLPLQVVDPPGPWTLPRIDLRALPEPLREEESLRLLLADADRPFDLARGPVVRMALVRLAADDHLLLLTCHHIVIDGWSMGVLVGELLHLYPAFAASRPSPLPELPFQYLDLAVRQRERLSGPEHQARIDWWKRELEGAPRLWSFPTDRPRQANPSHRGTWLLRHLPAGLVDRLKTLGVSEGASLYMVMLAALALVIHRWSGEDDVVLGSPVAGREREESERVIGVFLIPVPMRVDLSGKPTFRELLRRARQTALDGFTNQEFSYERLIEALGLKRERSHNPILQATLNMLNFPPSGGELPGGVEVEALSVGENKAKYDFTLYTTETPEGLSLRLLYAADLFDPPRMEALLDQLRAVLKLAMDHPETPIDCFPARAPAGSPRVW